MESILFAELIGGIGDAVIALPAIAGLAYSWPRARMTVLTFEPASTLLDDHPAIDELHVVPEHDASRPGGTRSFVERWLQQRRFDLAVSDARYEGVGEIIERASSRVVTDLWRSPPEDRRVSDRFVDVLRDERLINVDPQPPFVHVSDHLRAWAARLLSGLARPLIFLHVETKMRIKRWRAARFVETARALEQRGASLIVSGQHAPCIARAIGGRAIVWPRGLRELAAGLSLADLIVGPDTAAMHIASALGTPAVTLHGPTWHGRYGPPYPGIGLQALPSCQERLSGDFTRQRCWYGGTCPLGGWRTCMEEITPPQVVAACQEVLRRTGHGLPADADQHEYAQGGVVSGAAL